MRKISTLLKSLVFLASGALIMSSCQKESEFKPVEEGLPASLKLNLCAAL